MRNEKWEMRNEKCDMRNDNLKRTLGEIEYLHLQYSFIIYKNGISKSCKFT